MKLGNIYREAAKKLHRRRGEFIFSVLGSLYDRPLRPGCREFWEIFYEGRGMKWDSDNERILALLFAAAIADSERAR